MLEKSGKLPDAATVKNEATVKTESNDPDDEIPRKKSKKKKKKKHSSDDELDDEDTDYSE